MKGSILNMSKSFGLSQKPELCPAARQDGCASLCKGLNYRTYRLYMIKPHRPRSFFLLTLALPISDLLFMIKQSDIVWWTIQAKKSASTFWMRKWHLNGVICKKSLAVVRSSSMCLVNSAESYDSGIHSGQRSHLSLLHYEDGLTQAKTEPRWALSQFAPKNVYPRPDEHGTSQQWPFQRAFLRVSL